MLLATGFATVSQIMLCHNVLLQLS